MRASLCRRRLLAASVATAALGGLSRIAAGRHKPWHRKVLGTAAATLAELDVLKAGDRADLEFVPTSSDAETLARIKANPGEYDFAYLCSDSGTNLVAEGVAQPIAVAEMKNWSSVYEALRSSPSVAERDGSASSIPLDWSFVAAVANTADGAKLISSDRLFADYKRIAFWDDAQGVMLAMQALGTKDPYHASEDDFRSFAASFGPKREKIAASWNELPRLQELLKSGEADAAVLPSWSLQEIEKIAPAEADFAKNGVPVLVCGISVIAGSDVPQQVTKEFGEVLLDPEFGLKLMDAWGVAHSNRETVAKAAQEQPALIAALGPEAGATVLQNAVWVQAPSPGVAALIQSFRAALKP